MIFCPVFSPCLNFALLFYYNVKLALVTTAMVLVAMAIMVFLGYRQLSYARMVVDIANRISGLMLQLLAGITKLRVAGAEKRAFYLITRDFSEQRRTEYKGRMLACQLVTFQAVLPVPRLHGVFFYTAVALTGNAFRCG